MPNDAPRIISKNRGKSTEIRHSVSDWARSTASNGQSKYSTSDDISQAWGPNYRGATFVAAAFHNAGVFDDNFIKGNGWKNGAGYLQPLLSSNVNFQNISNKVDASRCSDLEEGDILIDSNLTESAIYTGECTIAQASDGKNGKIAGGGVKVVNYYNAPWSYIYRYEANPGKQDFPTPAPSPRPPDKPGFNNRPQYTQLNPSVASVIRDDLTCKESDLSDLEKKYCSMTVVGNENDLLNTVGNVISTVYTWVGIIAVIMIIIGGIMYSTSAGNPKKVKTAKDTIFYALIGLIVALSAFAITNFVLRSL